MHILDTVVYKGNRFKEIGTFDTKVYFKLADTLEITSHHLNHIFKGLSSLKSLYMLEYVITSKM